MNATPCHDPLLLVAHWARPLAQSAQRAGLTCVALDLFADLDTQRYARTAHCVAQGAALSFDAELALSAARRYGADCTALVYGAGFEHAPEQIERIAAGRRILGNSARTVRMVKDPGVFFAWLDKIGMAHPPTQLQPPAQTRGWLRKTRGAQGGAHVIDADRAPPPATGEHYYYQRRVQGVPHSVLFLADGVRARIVGFNQQLTAALGACPYVYAGALSNIELPHALRADMAAKLDALVARAGLIGLNGLDFMLYDEKYCVLELNARPPATLELYDPDFSEGLLALHIRACAGELADTALPAPAKRGQAIVYAPQPCRIPAHFAWPQWCADLPAPASTIATHAPVCSVHALGHDAVALKHTLSERRAELLDMLRAQQ